MIEGYVDRAKCKGTIHKWRINRDNGGNHYLAPEQCIPRLCGMLDGVPIGTSSPTVTDERYVQTYSGSVYKLGTIDPGYSKWLREHGYTHNPRRPLHPERTGPEPTKKETP